MTSDEFRKIGQLIGAGPYWQSEIARRLGSSSAMITRYLNGHTPMPDWLPHEMRKLLADHIEEVAKLLSLPGVPAQQHGAVTEAQENLTSAVNLLRLTEKDRGL
jgi:transcriptional regulator with XRE-family HTH domain